MKPTITALLFVLQCTVCMRQGTKGSRHIRSARGKAGGQGLLVHVHRDSPHHLPCGLSDRAGLVGGQWEAWGCPELAKRVGRTGRDDREGARKNKEVGARQLTEGGAWLGIVPNTVT